MDVGAGEALFMEKGGACADSKDGAVGWIIIARPSVLPLDRKQRLGEFRMAEFIRGRFLMQVGFYSIECIDEIGKSIVVCR